MSSSTRTERMWGAFARYSGAVGCALSVALAIYTLQFAGQAATDALLVGLVGSAVAFQLEILAKIGEKTKRGEEYSTLLRNFEEHPWLLKVTSSSVEAAARGLENTAVPQFCREVRSSFERHDLQLQQLAQGHLTCKAGDNSLMLDQYTRARTRVLGLSESADGDWWRSATGRGYLELNRSTVARGVQVERIFILDAALPSIDDVLRENVEAGVKTYVIDKQDVPSDLRVNLTLFDDVLGHEDRTNGDGLTVEYLYSTNPSDIGRLHNIFQRLRSRAQPSTATPLPAPPVPLPAPPAPVPAPQPLG